MQLPTTAVEPAVQPPDEATRLAELLSLRLLDSSPDERFDAITRLAIRLFRVPIALISLIDHDRQWFKSRQGLVATETPRDVSFCGHAILGDEVFVIEDAAADRRFADNPLVTEDPHIRFYAGFPVHAPDGSRVGTLCIIDRIARTFGVADGDLLRDLAGMVELELRGVHLALERDRTEAALRANEALLHEQEIALRDAARQKDEFLATLAHELRNPLAPILAGALVIKMRHPADEVVLHAQQIIERQTTHLARLVDDLLDIARITQGRVVLARQTESVVTLVADAVQAIGPAVQAAAHTLVVDVPHEGLQVDADATRITQSLLNLLNNAVKYTPDGGRIEVEVRRVEDQVRIAVRDNGVGVGPHDMDRIFGMFEQESRTVVRRRGGLGIGLALARRLVEMHGGTVTAHSAGMGQGSEFVLTLPLVTAPYRSQAPSACEAVLNVSHSVLVVDDNADALDTMRLLLELEGHVVRVASNGHSALQAVAVHRPELVLLDIGLPDMDGYQVARTLRRLYTDQCPTLVALTGWGQAQDRQRALDAGFSHHFTKPIDPKKLEDLLRRLNA